MPLPRKLTTDSAIDIVYTSSMVYAEEKRDFDASLKRLQKQHPNTKALEPAQGIFSLSYLAGSEKDRLKNFRQATREADWILPAIGGTGCVDFLRRLTDDDFTFLEKRRPIISGFSDATALVNYAFFKTKLQTFIFNNAYSMYESRYLPQLFDALQGKINTVSYHRESYHWITSVMPSKPIEGIAIGGNLGTFRDLLDVCDYRPRSWEPYILFIEDLDMDIEDLHRVIIALEARGVFKHIVALVVGRMNDRSHRESIRKLLFFKKQKPMQELAEMKNIFEYLISDVISDRIEDHDPLYILKIDNFGHFGSSAPSDNIFIPVGAKTTIHPDGRIEFHGPFVE